MDHNVVDDDDDDDDDDDVQDDSKWIVLPIWLDADNFRTDLTTLFENQTYETRPCEILEDKMR